VSDCNNGNAEYGSCVKMMERTKTTEQVLPLALNFAAAQHNV
jgi:hypothetical protein